MELIGVMIWEGSVALERGGKEYHESTCISVRRCHIKVFYHLTECWQQVLREIIFFRAYEEGNMPSR